MPEGNGLRFHFGALQHSILCLAQFQTSGLQDSTTMLRQNNYRRSAQICWHESSVCTNDRIFNVLFFSGLDKLSSTLCIHFEENDIHTDSRMKMLNEVKMSIFMAVQFLKLIQEKVDQTYSLVINKVRAISHWYLLSMKIEKFVITSANREGRKIRNWWSWKKITIGTGRRAKDWSCRRFVNWSDCLWVGCGIHLHRKRNSSGHYQ